MADDHSVVEIADLARRAAGFDLVKINTDGLGDGLPQNVTIGFDRRAQGNQPAMVDLTAAIERWRDCPRRRQGHHIAATLGSFCDLVNRLKTEASVIFAQTAMPEPSLIAIVNYHEQPSTGSAGFCDFQVEYGFPVTDEFNEWIEHDKLAMSQATFAAFIENRIAEIAAPRGDDEPYGQLFRTKIGTPADLIMLSRGLDVAVNSVVKQQVTLQSGEKQIVFSEEHATAVTVPGLFIVNVMPFVDGDFVRIPARLRYRVQNGSVQWFYELYNWRLLVRQRVVDDLSFAAETTGLPAFEGALA